MALSSISDSIYIYRIFHMKMMILGMVYGSLWHCLNLQEAIMIPEDVTEQLLVLSGAHWWLPSGKRLQCYWWSIVVNNND